MKQFNLDSVLKYRKRLSDQARNRYQHAQNQLIEAQEAFDRKNGEYLDLIATMVTLEVEGIVVDEHIRYQNRIEYIRAELLKLEETLNRKRAIVVQERKHLVTKSKEKRVLEKLKEKQNQEYRSYINKKEAALLDEVAVLHRNQQ
jgi:flagellar FliJ protein